MSDTFELEDEEAAVILRVGGEIELIMPEFEDDEIVPDDYLVLSAFMIGFQEPEFRRYMLSLFSGEFQEH